jgi:hypothetical protein
MRNVFIAAVTTLALGACSSGGTSGATGGTGTGGGTATTGGTTTGPAPTTITFTTVDVHPAATAALEAIGFPVPSITTGTYQLALKGVSVVITDGLPTIVLADAGFTTITSTTGPYAFTVPYSFLQNNATLGVLGGVNPIAASSLGDGGLPQPTCPEWAGLVAGVQGVIADGGTATEVSSFLTGQSFTDYLIPTGLLVGGIAQAPIADVTNAIAYAVPMSYAVMLNCAGNPGKTTRDSDLGEAVVYITNGTAAGQGTPVSGAVTPIRNAAGNPTATYYEDKYNLTDNTGTDSTGISTFVAVSPASTTPPTITVQGAAGLTFTADYGISTNPNTFFSIAAYPH